MINTLIVREGLHGAEVVEAVFTDRQEAIDMVTFEILGDSEYKILADNPKLFAVAYQEEPDEFVKAVVVHFYVDFIDYDIKDEYKAAIVTIFPQDSTVDIISVKNRGNVKKMIYNTAKSLSTDVEELFDTPEAVGYGCTDGTGQIATVVAYMNFVEEE